MTSNYIIHKDSSLLNIKHTSIIS